MLPAARPIVSASPRKWTNSRSSRYVRFVPKAAVSNRSKATLFDHLVGQLLKMQRHLEAKRRGAFQIDDQLELGG